MTTQSALSARNLFLIFAAALAIRWAYALTLYSAMGDAGLMGPDSTGYLMNARAFAEKIGAGHVAGFQWLGPSPTMMPLFTWLLTLHVMLVGTFAPLAYVLMQGAMDSAICVVVGLLAAEFSPRYAWTAAVAAILNPTQIVLSGLVYSDTPFAFFVASSLLLTGGWLRRSSWRTAILLGLSFGAAALCRVLIAPWVAVHLGLLLAFVVLRARERRRLIQLFSIAIIFCCALTPLVGRNLANYGAFALTSQGGVHLALWVAPLVKEAKDGTVWAAGAEEFRRRTEARFGAPSADPFEESRRYETIGREALAELGIRAVAKAWLTGIAINLASPAIIISPPVFALPRTGFFATAGPSLLDKIFTFLFRSDNRLYGLILILGVSGVAIVRLIQVAGLVAIVAARENFILLAICLLFAAFILAVNGPIASPKYRLPIEPILMVLLGAGWATLWDRWKRHHS